jgi:lipopolysaccharide biosynthesis glycosyltransferase
VAKRSILSRTTQDQCQITPLKLSELPKLTRPIERRGNQMWCPISAAPMATEFAISRFTVPLIHSEGWALFADSDIICLANIEELFALADEKYAVMVVKHQQGKGPDTKMDQQMQTFYLRKNWSSVMLINCDHPANRRLTWKMVNSWPGRELHRFGWLEDHEIGELPKAWNWLVNVDKGRLDGAKLLHYTLGGPWLEGWQKHPYDDWWLIERDRQIAAMPRN